MAARMPLCVLPRHGYEPFCATVFFTHAAGRRSLRDCRGRAVHSRGAVETCDPRARDRGPRNQRPVDRLWPQHSPEEWRSASSFAVLSADEPDTPVLAISPFVEAIPPVWSPDYGLPGFLYAPLFVYPVRGRIYPLPAQTSGEYALKLMAEVGFPRRRFILYGRDQELAPLMKSLAARPELGGWEVSANRF